MTENGNIQVALSRIAHAGSKAVARLTFHVAAIFCLASTIFVTLAAADGINVNKAELRLSEGGYQLTANYDIDLNSVLKQALSRGIPLYFVGEFSLTASRWYWFDKEVFRSEQTVKLSYNVLTQQYRIARGALFQNFASLEDALNILARQYSTTLPSELIRSDGKYVAAARLRLDTTQLPKLLQVNALTDNDWTFDSDWYRWVVRPADIIERSK